MASFCPCFKKKQVEPEAGGEGDDAAGAQGGGEGDEPTTAAANPTKAPVIEVGEGDSTPAPVHHKAHKKHKHKEALTQTDETGDFVLSDQNHLPPDQDGEQSHPHKTKEGHARTKGGHTGKEGEHAQGHSGKEGEHGHARGHGGKDGEHKHKMHHKTRTITAASGDSSKDVPTEAAQNDLSAAHAKGARVKAHYGVRKLADFDYEDDDEENVRRRETHSK